MTTVYASPPYGYYWLVTDSSPSTQVWSADAGAFVVLADAGYVAWAATHTTPTYDTIANLLLGIDAYNKSQYASYNNGYAASTITTDTALTNPIALWYNISNSTADDLKVKLPQANVPGSIPIGQPLFFYHAGGTKSFKLGNVSGTAISSSINPGSALLAILNSNSSSDGSWSTFIVQEFPVPATLSSGDLLYWQSIAAGWTKLSLGTSGSILQAGGSVPAYTTATYPTTAGADTFLYATSSNVIAAINVATAQQKLGYPYFNVTVSGVDFNTTAPADIATFAIASPTTNYRFSAVMISQCSASMSSSHFEIWTAAGGTGTKIVNDTTGAVTTASANTSGSLQVVAPSISTFLNSANLYLRLITAQGSPVTGKVTVQLQPLP